jgi:hypothetical protein
MQSLPDGGYPSCALCVNVWIWADRGCGKCFDHLYHLTCAQIEEDGYGRVAAQFGIVR